MKKFKNCKGQGKASKFPGCNKPVLAQTRKYGLCRDCLKDWTLSTDEGDQYLKSIVIPRAKRVVEKQTREASREEKLASRDYNVKLQDKVNEIVRLIDIGLPCLAKGYHADRMNAGHIFSRGAEKFMRFNLHNIHRQSAQSNWKQSDDVILREKLRAEYGDYYFEFLNGCRQTAPLHYSNAEYRAFYKIACKIATRMKKEGRTFPRASQRIIERNRINLELGIYPSEFGVYPNI